MRRKISIPASKPRNRVVLALTLLTIASGGRHTRAKRQKDHDRKDVDQRVREVGEW
ncbi:short-chain dehydrogenase [Hydrogenophaga sp. NFH-34]|uniref:short-chain dehydrogenase n=1 Tax=Hydrogenophaga sp. NFH-34 TaxID=2744446 RepID=UPI001F3E4C1C|nr:short-chain dehydrogenase [Hydrogenophaga sp. NFH-34]